MTMWEFWDRHPILAFFLLPVFIVFISAIIMQIVATIGAFFKRNKKG